MITSTEVSVIFAKKSCCIMKETVSLVVKHQSVVWGDEFESRTVSFRFIFLIEEERTMKLNMPKFIKSMQKSLVKHSPELLTAAGIGLGLTTVVLAVKATPKALKQIEEAKEEKGEKLTPVETVKVAWKPYIPAMISGGVSVACVIGANSVHTRRQAALYSAYKLSETAFSEYKDKVVETVGKEKEQEIREKASEERVNNLVFHEEGVVHTGDGNTLFFDPISKTVFRSSQSYIEKAINNLNWKMTHGNEPYMALADFYDEIHLPSYALGNDIGWRTDKGLIDISFPAAKTDTGEPCLSLEYLVPPQWDYDQLY